MKTRDEAARAFAEKMDLGRALVGERGDIIFTGDSPLSVDHVPAPDAPLPEQLAFVGRVAVAIGADPALYRQKFENDGEIVNGWCVYFEVGDQAEGEAADPCHAALLAALAALEAR